VKVENGVELFIQRSDGASIPLCPGNRDYDEFVVVDTKDNLCKRSVWPPPLTTDQKWAALLAERDRRVLQAQGLGEFILYQAESALVAAGRLAEKDRIVSEDRMLKVAEYLRALYRLDDEKEKGTDPDDVVIPVLPRKEAAVEPVKESR